MNSDLTIANIMLGEAKSLIDHQSIKRSSKPHLVVLGGQPGSGKSSAIEIIETKFNSNIISLNGDDFKRFYPNYRAITRRSRPHSN
jgi:uridine kinase